MSMFLLPGKSNDLAFSCLLQWMFDDIIVPLQRVFLQEKRQTNLAHSCFIPAITAAVKFCYSDKQKEVLR